MSPTDVVEALRRNRTIDITTTGAKSGRPRRIETWAWVDGDTVYLTGSPGRRDWYANLRANPDFTVHLKHGVQADVPARARPIEDRTSGGRSSSGSGRPRSMRGRRARPLVEVEFS